MKIVIGGYSHETNTFSNVKTTIDSFKLRSFGILSGIYFDEEIITHFDSTKSVFGGMIASSRMYGFDSIPTFFGAAFPSGIVAEETFQYIENSLIEEIEKHRDINGVLLHLHGAMVAENEDDPEGHTLKVVRNLVGKETPIVSVIDYHGNISETMVKEADVLIGYKTSPHTDYYERGFEGGKIVASVIRGQLKPTVVFKKPPILVSGQKSNTRIPPMNVLTTLANEMEKEKGIINVTVNAGFCYADIPKMGFGIVITTNNNLRLAEKKAKLLEDLALDMRQRFISQLTSVDEAVQRVVKAKEGPIILSDQGDNALGGGPADGTVLLKALLDAGVDATIVICDRGAVEEAIRAGVDRELELTIGGKTDTLHGIPVKVRGKLKLISDGKFMSEYISGHEVNMGRTVDFQSRKIQIVITELKAPQLEPRLFRSVGIEPSEKKAVVVKSHHGFRVLFDPFAKEVIEVDTPGICGDTKSLTYHKIRRPIFPLDEI